MKIYHIEHSMDAFPLCWNYQQRHAEAPYEKYLTALFKEEVNCPECIRIMAGALDAF